MSESVTKPKRILAIASGGGHWVQLLRMRPAWDGCVPIYVTTQKGYREQVFADARESHQPTPRFYTVLDANRWQKVRLVRQLLQITWILLRERPDFVISTGAAPGFFALKIARRLGARTIWIDSIANAEQLSLSGRKAGPTADLWLTQWSHLAGSIDPEQGRPHYEGAVV